MKGIIENKEVSLLIDTGATLSLLKEGVSSQPIFPCLDFLKGVTGTALDIKGIQKMVVRITNKFYPVNFRVSYIQIPHEGIIGLDILIYSFY